MHEYYILGNWDDVFRYKAFEARVAANREIAGCQELMDDVSFEQELKEQLIYHSGCDEVLNSGKQK